MQKYIFILKFVSKKAQNSIALLKKNMKAIWTLMGMFLLVQVYSQRFNEYFTNERLRIEYFLTGNAEKATITISNLYLEPKWSGSTKNLIDTFNFGHYRLHVYDSAQAILLYSYGFCTLFQEWQLTPEAKTTYNTFSQFVNIPFPKRTIKVVFYERQKNQQFKELAFFYIRPNQFNIIKEKPEVYPVVEYLKNGLPEHKVDIAIVAEGYKEDQMEKFKNDAVKFTEILFSKEPFKQLKTHFNVTFVKSPSVEEGTDKPHLNVWKKTAVETRFNTFNMDRYLSVNDYNRLGKILSNVAYDQIIVLVNTKKYGGGGIYNYYSIAVADNPFADYVFIHEFGHAFGGLADEYQTSDEANENFYDLSVEPWEANITTLVNFDKKWKNMLDKKTPIPTPVAGYENKVGVFEGAGYRNKGIYRPVVNCIMRDFQKLEFCPVCQNSLRKLILFNSGK